MSNLRDKYKATQVSVLKNKISEEDSMIGSNSSKRDDYHDINDGTNKFRIFPKKDSEDTFYQLKVVHWLTLENEDGEEFRKSIFNGRVHGNLKEDVVESYIKFAKQLLSGEDDSESASKKLGKITGWKDGLMPSTTWVCYANKITGVGDNQKKVFGMLDMKKSVRDALNKEAMFEDPDEPITVDPYTDPDTGKYILLTYDSKSKKAQDYYSVKIGKVMELDDDELEEFDGKKSLSEIFTNSYQKSDFDKAVEGLRIFDNKHDIGVFDEPEWDEIVENIKTELESLLEDSPTKKSKSTPNNVKAKDTKKAKVKEVVEEMEEMEEEAEEIEEMEEEMEGDKFTEMDRGELKTYIVKNKYHHEPHSMKILQSDDDETIREKIRGVESSPKKSAKVEKSKETSKKPEVDKVSSKKPTLAEIKARLGK